MRSRWRAGDRRRSLARRRPGVVPKREGDGDGAGAAATVAATVTKADAEAAWLCYRILMVEVKKYEAEYGAWDPELRGSGDEDEDEPDSASDSASGLDLEGGTRAIKGTAVKETPASMNTGVDDASNNRTAPRSTAGGENENEDEDGAGDGQEGRTRTGSTVSDKSIDSCTISANRANALMDEMKAQPKVFSDILKKRVGTKLKSVLKISRRMSSAALFSLKK